MKKSIYHKNLAKTGSILGLDFGLAKIGLAIADEETKMAFAYDTLENDRDFLLKLSKIVECENAKAIIVGIPTFKANEKIVQAKEFGEKIAKSLGIKVYFQDEMFTTKMAQENIKKRGGREISKKDDQEAARIILQSWLDRLEL